MKYKMLLGAFALSSHLALAVHGGMGGNKPKSLTNKTFQKIVEASEENSEGLIIIPQEELFMILQENSMEASTLRGGNTNDTHAKNPLEGLDPFKGNSN